MDYAMLFQETTPDTSGYMIAGYVVFVVIMAIYLLSFLTRRRNLEQDLATLRTVEAESKSMRPAPRAPKPRSPKPTVRKAQPTKATPGGRGRVKKRSSRRR